MQHLESRRHHAEPTRDVGAEHAGLDGLDVTADICLGLEDAAVLREFVEDGLVLVGEHNVCLEGLREKSDLNIRTVRKIIGSEIIKECSNVSTTMIFFTSLSNFMSLCASFVLA